MHDLPATLAALWQALGESPVARCSSYTETFLRAERIADFAIFAAYFCFPLRGLIAARKMRSSVPFPSLVFITLAFIIACGTTHLLKILTGYYPDLLSVSLGASISTAAISWAAVFAIEGAWRSVRDHLNGTGAPAARGATRASLAYALILVTGLSVLSVGTWGYTAISGLVGQMEIRRQEGLAMLAMRDATEAIRRAETSQRGYLLTGGLEFLAEYRERSDAAKDLLSRSARSPIWPAGDFAELRGEATEKLGELENTITLAGEGRWDDAIVIVTGGRGRELMESIDRRASAMFVKTMDVATERTARIERSSNAAMVAIPTVGVLTPLGMAGSIAMMVRASRRKSAADTLARVATEIGTANTRAAVAEKQAAVAEAVYQKAEAERQQRDAEAARAESARNAHILNALQHDLRTPLNGIAQNAQFGQILAAMQPPGMPKIVEQFGKIRRQAIGMKDLLDQFLETSKAEYLKPDAVTFDVAALLKDAIEFLQPMADAKGVAISVQCEPGLLGRTDRRFVNRIIINLMDNAVKYTERGSVTVTAAHGGDGGFTLSVRDTGKGIAREMIPRLFGEFVQADNSARDPRKGFGLGLSLVRRMVDSLGGRMVVESEVGKGSCFTAEFPDLIDQPIGD